MPLLSVFAGPNGSGKSSFVARFGFGGKENLLDPDAVAKRLDPIDPARAAVAAGREVIERAHEYLERGESFAIETTLAGRSALSVMEEAKRLGFEVRLVYICLADPYINVRRVDERVAKGGHSVPGPDIRRRYARSLANLRPALRIADEAIAYDNSGPTPRRVFEARNGIVTWRNSSLPDWAKAASEA